MKAIVIYKSNTGFTKKYAGWIAEVLSCEAVPIENLKSLNLDCYDTLVFGGWYFAGNIQGLKKIKNQILTFKGKKAIFATGATPPTTPDAVSALASCLTDEEHKAIGTFYMQGGLDYTHMGFVNKTMMKMMCRMMKKQHGADSEEYKTISQSFDGADRAAIKPLVEYFS